MKHKLIIIAQVAVLFVGVIAGATAGKERTMKVFSSRFTKLGRIRQWGTWVALTAAALALIALSSSADASLPVSASAITAPGTQSIQTGVKDQPFDCSQIEAKGIDRQMNVRARQILVQCGKAGPSGQTSNPGKGAGGSIIGRPLSPLAFGGVDKDIVLPEGNYPNVTQSTTMSWAHGNVVIVSHEDYKTAGACYADYSYSTDAGATWTAAGGSSGNNGLCTGHGTNYGDSMVMYNAALNMWFLGNLVTGCGGQGVGLWTTTDANPGTLTVGACAANTSQGDWPKMWVDNNPSSPHYGRMYISFNNFNVGGGALQAVYSDDGTTWSSFATISPSFVRNVQITGDLAGSGNVYLVGMDEGGGGLTSRTNLMYRSTDGGVTWSSALPMGPSFDAPGRSMCSGSSYFVCMFGTNTWRYMGWGQLAAVGNIVSYDYTQCGGSAPCSSATDKGDVYFVRSTDAGLTWATPIKLNSDAGTSTQWQPSLAATSSGALLASWYDSREVNGGADLDCTPGSSTQMCYRRWGRVSLDGGATWQTDDTIGDALSPLPAQPNPFLFEGDYNFASCDTTVGFTTNCYDHWTDGRVIVNGVAQQDVFLDKIQPGISTCIEEATVGPWTPVATYTVTVRNPAVATDGTYLYSMGGLDSFRVRDIVQRYDPAANTWTSRANLPIELEAARAAYAAVNNKIYVFGGYNSSGNVLNTVFIYDIASDTWNMGASMPAPRRMPNVAYYSGNQKIYVIGGHSVGPEESQTWEYDPVANTWNTSRAPIPVAMGSSATSIVGQYIYLMGSYGGGGGTTLHYSYDIVNDAWATRASLPQNTFLAAAGAVGDTIVMFGGGNGFLAYNSSYIYNIATDSWTNGPNMTTAHAYTGGTAIGNRLAVVGGWNGNTYTNVVERAIVTTTPCPTNTPTNTPTPVASPTSPPTYTPTNTVIPTDTATVTRTPTITNSPTPTLAPNFSINVTPSSQTVVRPGAVQFAVTLTSLNGFSGNVILFLSGLPAQTSGSFNPPVVFVPSGGTGSSILTITANRGGPRGSFTLTVTGTSGAISHSQNVTLVVMR